MKVGQMEMLVEGQEAVFAEEIPNFAAKKSQVHRTGSMSLYIKPFSNLLKKQTVSIVECQSIEQANLATAGFLIPIKNDH